jgi:AcrR family transcriptional regulator
MSRATASTSQAGDNRERLLALSATLFATQGYAQVSVRDLAAQLDVTTGAIYSNFRSKGDLLAAVLEVRIREDMERSQRTRTDLWLPDAVHESFIRSSERIQMRALLLEAGAAARTDTDLRESLRPPLTALTSQWIEDYRAWQQFGKVDPDIDIPTLLTVLWAIELGMGVLEAQGVVGVKPASMADFIGTFLQAIEGQQVRSSPKAGRRGAGSATGGQKSKPSSRTASASRMTAVPSSRLSSDSAEEPTTRERLIDAAIELFSEQGYAAVAVRDLARKTGLTTGSIYGNFANKAILLVEAIESRLAQDLELMPLSLIKSGSPADLIEFHLENFAHRTQLRALLIEGAAAARSDSEVHDRLRELELRHQEFWVAGFERWLTAYKTSPSVDTQTAIQSMWCAELGLGLLEALDLDTPNPSAIAALFGRIFSTFGLANPKGPAVRKVASNRTSRK